ncbi:cysteine hydrolase family protein [Lentibacillus cibarius]|uniref:Cysteine hydrolase n=1 Tax=Lentibacillus cibarius TaxID=2583219 RepID=A0A5S3QJ04_9BACI|nr:isochorismatase family cysteine hydrolase [Lentibacillus cibarius]TMN21808.1 cysteine hydrolase [Lentibacillus cibarius]
MDIKKTALVLIDTQKESEFGIEGLEQAVNNSKNLIEACRSYNIPIIYTRHVSRADGVGLPDQEPINENGTPIYYASNTADIEVIDAIRPKEEDIVIDKHRWSGFYETSLDLMLRSLGVEHLIIGGFVTDGCLFSSVYDAYFRDYKIHLVKDICAATNEGAHMSSILILANWVYNIRIYNANEMIKKLKGEEHNVWISTAPDQLQFTPENMRAVFNQLDQ